MPLVNGTLTDFGLDPLATYAPRLTFRAAAPGTDGLGIYTTRPVEVVPAANGYFEVDLIATDALAAANYYNVQVHWTDVDPTRKDRTETLPWRLHVPPEGGALGDLLAAPASPGNVWVGADAPESPSAGTWWLDPETGELSEWSN